MQFLMLHLVQHVLTLKGHVLFYLYVTIRMLSTCPLFTSSSSSTHGVKSCNTTILLSGARPFSFSIPTLTKVSIEALPVMRPIPGVRTKSLSTSDAETYKHSSIVCTLIKKKIYIYIYIYM